MKITNCKLSKRVQKKLLEFFVLQVTTRSAADILDIQPNSAILFYRKILMVISHHLALIAGEVFEGPVELDESYFGRHCKGSLGRSVVGKVVVFGILKRNGRVYTVVVDNAKSDTLMPVIKQKIMPDSIVYTDSLSSYNKLDVSGFIHSKGRKPPTNEITCLSPLTVSQGSYTPPSCRTKLQTVRPSS